MSSGPRRGGRGGQTRGSFRNRTSSPNENRYAQNDDHGGRGNSRGHGTYIPPHARDGQGRGRGRGGGDGHRQNDNRSGQSRRQMRQSSDEADSDVQSAQPATSPFSSSSGKLKGVPKGDYAARYEYLKKKRVQDRKDAIAQHKMLDPEKRYRLDQAITMVGECMDMCPEYERVQRIIQNDVMLPEFDPATINGPRENRVPDELLMVKKFRRSAAGNEAALPGDIRPPPVLSTTCDYLFVKLLEERELPLVANFIWDRSRAIRNDFTIQGSQKPQDIRISIDCHEQIARWHLLSLHQMTKAPATNAYDHKQDLEQLNSTFISLRNLYNDCRKRKVISPNEAEIRAYMLIADLRLRVPKSEDELQAFPSYVLHNRRFQTAVKIFQAGTSTIHAQGPLRPHLPYSVARQNWQGFWSLLRSPEVSYLMACAAEISFRDVRHGIITAILRAYRQGGGTRTEDWTIADLIDVLGFDTPDEAISFCECYGFSFGTSADGTQFLDLTSVSGRELYEPSHGIPVQSFSTSIVESKRYNRTFSGIIKGLSVRDCRKGSFIEQQGLAKPVREDSNEDDSLFIPERSSKSAEVGLASGNLPSSSALNPFASPFQPGGFGAGQLGSTSSGSLGVGNSAFGKPVIYTAENTNLTVEVSKSNPFGIAPVPSPFNPTGSTQTNTPSSGFGKPSFLNAASILAQSPSQPSTLTNAPPSGSPGVASTNPTFGFSTSITTSPATGQTVQPGLFDATKSTVQFAPKADSGASNALSQSRSTLFDASKNSIRFAPTTDARSKSPYAPGGSEAATITTTSSPFPSAPTPGPATSTPFSFGSYTPTVSTSAAPSVPPATTTPSQNQNGAFSFSSAPASAASPTTDITLNLQSTLTSQSLGVPTSFSTTPSSTAPWSFSNGPSTENQSKKDVRHFPVPSQAPSNSVGQSQPSNTQNAQQAPEDTISAQTILSQAPSSGSQTSFFPAPTGNIQSTASGQKQDLASRFTSPTQVSSAISGAAAQLPPTPVNIAPSEPVVSQREEQQRGDQIRQEKERSYDTLATNLLMETEGLLDQFVEWHIRSVFNLVGEQLKAEKERAEEKEARELADKFREWKLAIKVVRRLQAKVYSSSLKSYGRNRRQRLKQMDFGPSILNNGSATVISVQNGASARQSVGNQTIAATTSPPQARATFNKPAIPAKTQRSNAQPRSQPRVQSTLNLNRSTNSLASSQSSYVEMKKSFLGTMYNDPNVLIDRTETDYFRLKAMGISRKRSLSDSSSDGERTKGPISHNRTTSVDQKRLRTSSIPGRFATPFAPQEEQFRSPTNQDVIVRPASLPRPTTDEDEEMLARWHALKKKLNQAASSGMIVSRAITEVRPIDDYTDPVIREAREVRKALDETEEIYHEVAEELRRSLSKDKSATATPQASPPNVQNRFSRSLPVRGHGHSASAADRYLGKSTTNTVKESTNRPAYWNRVSRFVPRELYGKGAEAIRAAMPRLSTAAHSSSMTNVNATIGDKDKEKVREIPDSLDVHNAGLSHKLPFDRRQPLGLSFLIPTQQSYPPEPEEDIIEDVDTSDVVPETYQEVEDHDMDSKDDGSAEDEDAEISEEDDIESGNGFGLRSGEDEYDEEEYSPGYDENEDMGEDELQGYGSQQSQIPPWGMGMGASGSSFGQSVNGGAGHGQTQIKGGTEDDAIELSD
ncbi:hypothetical protein K469DRAFT_691765 [Zopfia rhizophila CBS 207.26]|uniref:SAC3/GANP/THP3 conserved domain-containing protein n=1 Tax=Zopfia rhizophila CBS 207.26 TaxID=1314779 RepID=A0A6A6DQ10_9PEZI|nr:hypothetical protein K469DRAFT_691765 [Zopfia rhizophila CBS 207.26]